MQVKSGSSLAAAHSSLLHAEDCTNMLWHRIGLPGQPVITENQGGTHSKLSLHYGKPYDFRCRAFDLRTRTITKAQTEHFSTHLHTLLGTSFDVVVESDHIHVEFDPKYGGEHLVP